MFLHFTNILWDKLSLYVSKRNIILGFVIIILFNLILLPGFPKIFSVPGNYPLDLKFGYSPAEAYKLLSDMGGKGRTVYLLSEIIIDWPYAVIYTFVYSVVIIAVYKNFRFSFRKYLIWAPLFLGIFDLLENSGIVLMIALFDYKITAPAYAASMFTKLKWSFAVLTFLLVLIGLILKSLSRK